MERPEKDPRVKDPDQLRKRKRPRDIPEEEREDTRCSECDDAHPCHCDVKPVDPRRKRPL